ncbi:MAG TPA: ribonuclease J [Firmicutes bacterium]|nr:ribonuclease J [Bacillota bacterium]
MEEAGYKPSRRSRAKGKGTKLPAQETDKQELSLKSSQRSKDEVRTKSERREKPVKTEKGERSEKSARNEKGERGRKKKPVKILFFGGVGEIGKNMTAIEYGNDIIVIDAGIIFPTEEMPGIDLVFPDISYLVNNRQKIRGVFLTHGHEDHIGGVPYLMKELLPETPLYGTKLTLALVDNKLREHRMNNVVERTVKPKDSVRAGVFTVNFVNVNHSIAGSLALAVETPYGIIFHSGDFKIDLTPVAGSPIDLAEIAEYGKKGVLLYLGESTNIERPGYTMSEKVVGTTLEHIFAENADRRIVIATFASNVHRLQQIVDIAVKFRRKVALSGRSMFNVVEAAAKIGEITIPEGVLVDVEKTKNFFDREIVIISTGSQGEPMSALTRMAAGEFNKVTIGPNDTIVISASPIPGNERMIYRVINNLYQKGANVVYESLEKIHVSGHACQEEHKIMHTLLKPKFFIPVHGEYRHLKRHALLAQELGMKPAQIFIPEIGACAEVTDETLTQGNSFPAGARLIDGAGFEDYGTSEVLKDRIRMSEEGLFVISVALSKGVLMGEPIIESRGFVFSDERDYMRDLKDIVEKAIDSVPAGGGNAEISAAVRRAVKSYLFKKTKQSPMILTIIQEI